MPGLPSRPRTLHAHDPHGLPLVQAPRASRLVASCLKPQALSVAMLSLMVTAIPSLTAPDCAAGFVEAQLNLRQFELYPTWFDDNTSLTLAQTGVYEGVDDIKEFTIDIRPR